MKNLKLIAIQILLQHTTKTKQKLFIKTCHKIMLQPL